MSTEPRAEGPLPRLFGARAPIALCALSLAALALACGPKATLTSPVNVADTSDPSVARGRELYTAKCNKCHSYADPQGIAEAKWPETVEEMGKKADLNESDRQAVLHYILAARKQGPSPAGGAPPAGTPAPPASSGPPLPPAALRSPHETTVGFHRARPAS